MNRKGGLDLGDKVRKGRVCAFWRWFGHGRAKCAFGCSPSVLRAVRKAGCCVRVKRQSGLVRPLPAALRQ